MDLTMAVNAARNRPLVQAGMALAILIAGPASAPAQQAPAPGEPGYGVRFNQHLLEQIAGSPTFDVDDTMATFRHVFAALPDDAQVYPTENYYYFTFFHGGVEYAGNLRLDAADRVDGVLHFAYYPQNTPWGGETETVYRALSAADGVTVRREDELVYRVTHEDRTVRFFLNDLSDAKPPAGVVRDDEHYLGPVFDEAGIGFFLLFDEARREFMFVLDERDPPHDDFVPVHPDHPALTIGRRTGFAVYEDRFAPRRILVGVYLENVILNNYLDGPFDQLPDNFIEGDALHDAIIAKHPDLEGEIDRFGGFRAHHGRFLVNPYLNYARVEELEGLLRCGDPALDEVRFYACLVPEDHH
jgi:hypothetical protein